MTPTTTPTAMPILLGPLLDESDGAGEADAVITTVCAGRVDGWLETLELVVELGRVPTSPVNPVK